MVVLGFFGSDNLWLPFGVPAHWDPGPWRGAPCFWAPQREPWGRIGHWIKIRPPRRKKSKHQHAAPNGIQRFGLNRSELFTLVVTTQLGAGVCRPRTAWRNRVGPTQAWAVLPQGQEVARATTDGMGRRGTARDVGAGRRGGVVATAHGGTATVNPLPPPTALSPPPTWPAWANKNLAG